jgi:exodeoxyribonuclease VII small subunit
VTEPVSKPAAKKRTAAAAGEDGADSGADPSATAEVATYELARDELAAVVHKLESGGLSLDESLTLWERGEHLAAVCSRFLDNARERVESALARADQE